MPVSIIEQKQKTLLKMLSNCEILTIKIKTKPNMNMNDESAWKKPLIQKQNKKPD